MQDFLNSGFWATWAQLTQVSFLLGCRCSMRKRSCWCTRSMCISRTPSRISAPHATSALPTVPTCRSITGSTLGWSRTSAKFASASLRSCAICSSTCVPTPGKKPYKCTHVGCGKAFTQLSNLQSHSRSHMTDKPYRCNSCYKCYSDEASLREHIPKHSETKHLKTQICHICGKSYTQETYLARHMQKHNFDSSNRGGLMAKPLSVNLAGMQEEVAKGLLSPSNTLSSPMGLQEGPKASSAFMPLSHQYGNSAAVNMNMNMMNMNSGMPSSPFPFPPPRLPSTTLNSQLPHISSVSSPRYFPFEASALSFPKRESSERGPIRDGMIQHSLLSLQQIKNFSATHGAVFPKSEPSSPTPNNKDFIL